MLDAISHSLPQQQKINLDLDPIHLIHEAVENTYWYRNSLAAHEVQENNKLIDQLEVIHQVLTEINNRSHGQADFVDLSSLDPQLMESLKAINPALVTEMKRDLKNIHVQTVKENLTDAGKNITNKMNPRLMRITDELQKRNLLPELFAKILQMDIEGRKTMVTNQKPR